MAERPQSLIAIASPGRWRDVISVAAIPSTIGSDWSLIIFSPLLPVLRPDQSIAIMIEIHSATELACIRVVIRRRVPDVTSEEQPFRVGSSITDAR